MVGTTVAVFTAVEVKTGRVPVTAAQTRFLDAVTAAGGIARVTRE
jgi:protein involved in polysaccharide export with SLBB domain